jgi:hypothetical protein
VNLREALARARDTVGVVPPAERALVDELLAHAEEMLRGAEGERLPADSGRHRDVARLVELVARREARAMPFAAMGRGMLAELSGAAKDAAALYREFDEKLMLLGL